MNRKMGFSEIKQAISPELRDSGLIPKFTLEEKLELLGIDEDKKEQVQKLTYVEVDYEKNDYKEANFEESILVKNLIGVNRGRLNNTNWIEALSKLEHDNPFIYISEGNSFNDFIQMVDKDFPGEKIRVLKDSNGKYVINNDGMHRLTIAKCLGVEKISVTVTELKEQISFVNS